MPVNCSSVLLQVLWLCWCHLPEPLSAEQKSHCQSILAACEGWGHFQCGACEEPHQWGREEVLS